MITIAQTSTGIQTGKTWFNNRNNNTSKLVNTGDIPEIIGDMTNEEFSSYEDIEEINAQLDSMSFTETPEFTTDSREYIKSQIYYSQDRTSAYINSADFENPNFSEIVDEAELLLLNYTFVEIENYESGKRAIWHKN